MSKTISSDQVKHIATLANIPISSAEEDAFAEAFTETLEVVDGLKKVDTKNVEPTHQVTGLENVLRQDEVHSETMFTQKQAIANASQTYKGYFVVPQVIEK